MHNAICVGHHYAQTKTDNGNKTQIIGGKDEPNIVCIRTSQRTSRHGAHERLTVSTSYKTPVLLLIYTIQSGKSLGTHRGKKTFTYKVHNLLSFEMWIFHNVNRIVITTLSFLKRSLQPVCNVTLLE